eukprot:scaffold35913_cov62-Isochrysis_galbana.AAC.1
MGIKRQRRPESPLRRFKKRAKPQTRRAQWHRKERERRLGRVSSMGTTKKKKETRKGGSGPCRT